MSIEKPDWKNPADYPFDDKTTLDQWTWEFLRRNPDYRTDYQMFQTERETLRKKLGSNWHKCEEAKKCVPRKLPEETDWDWKLRCDGLGKKAQCLPLERAYAHYWGMDGKLHDPKKNWGKTIKFRPVSKSFPRLSMAMRPAPLLCRL